MKNSIIGFVLLLFSTVVVQAQYNNSQFISLEINVEELASNDGAIALQLLSEENRKVASAYINISEGRAKVVFNYLKPGKYAVKLFHDENGNGKMETNFLSIPTEGYGFSNDAIGAFNLPPDFEEMLFYAIEDTSIKIRLVY